jgi:hypothetical protein
MTKPTTIRKTIRKNNKLITLATVRQKLAECTVMLRLDFPKGTMSGELGALDALIDSCDARANALRPSACDLPCVKEARKKAFAPNFRCAA